MPTRSSDLAGPPPTPHTILHNSRQSCLYLAMSIINNPKTILSKQNTMRMPVIQPHTNNLIIPTSNLIRDLTTPSTSRVFSSTMSYSDVHQSSKNFPHSSIFFSIQAIRMEPNLAKRFHMCRIVKPRFKTSRFL